MTPIDDSIVTLKLGKRRRRLGFAEDFRRFFLGGLAALLPTLITLWLLVWGVGTSCGTRSART